MSTTESTRSRVVEGEWTLLLPAGWRSLPTDQWKAPVAVRQLTAWMVQGKHRDELVQLRIDLEQTLIARLERAREQGATACHLLVEPVRGVPVSASLVVTSLYLGGDGELSEGLGRMFGTPAGVVEEGPVVLAGVRGVRRVRRHQGSIEGDPDATSLWHTNVDYVLETEPGGLLLLNFGTSTDPVWEQLVVLFDAIAATLHRRLPVG